MPFGLSNAPATFQRCIDVVLSGLKYNSCLVYLDDILVFSSTFDEHLTRLENVFIKLINANLKFNVSKSMFAMPEVTYLGYRITENGQYPEQSKLDAVRNFPIPTKLRDVRAFIAFCSYYRKFIKNFASIAKPLTRLTKLDVGFQWTETEQKAFDTLRLAMMSSPILAHFDPELETEVRTDASKEGLGACILQKYDVGWRPIAFASRQLSKHEVNYSNSE